MKIEVHVHDRLVTVLRGLFGGPRGRIWAVAAVLLTAVGALALPALTVFQPKTAILSKDVNANFAALGGAVDAHDKTIASLQDQVAALQKADTDALPVVTKTSGTLPGKDWQEVASISLGAGVWEVSANWRVVGQPFGYCSGIIGFPSPPAFPAEVEILYGLGSTAAFAVAAATGVNADSDCALATAPIYLKVSKAKLGTATSVKIAGNLAATYTSAAPSYTYIMRARRLADAP